MGEAAKEMTEQPLGERVLSRIRGDVLSLKLAPGEVVSERSLETTYGVSRTPIRQALAELIATPFGRAIKRSGDCGWGVESIPYGLLGLAIAAAGYGVFMAVGAAPLLGISFGALSGAAGCLLSSRPE